MASAKLSAYDYDTLHAMHGYAERGESVKSTIKIGNNTESHLHTGPLGDQIYISLHGHKIVCLFPNGNIGINMCGWDTVTTRGRINWFLPPRYGVTQRDYRQYLTTPSESMEIDIYGWYVVNPNNGTVYADRETNREAVYV